MVTRFFLILTVVCLYVSCTNRGNKKEQAHVPKDSLQPYRQRLEYLAQLPDSFPAYIRLNAALRDSAVAWNNTPFADECYDNIIRRSAAIEKDTALARYLLDAYFRRAKNIFRRLRSYEYNDSVVNYLENFLRVSKLAQMENPGRQTEAYNRLGIQYNVLGDLKRSLACYRQALVICKQENDNYNIASNVTNVAIAWNDERRFDSVIALVNQALPLDIAPKQRAVLYACLATAQAGIGLTAAGMRSMKSACAIIDTFSVTDDLNIWERRADIYLEKAAVEKIAGDTVAAENSLRSSLTFALKNNKGNFRSRNIGKRLIAIGDVLLNRNTDSALNYYQQALYTVTNADPSNIFSLPSEKDIYAENTIWEALDAKARALEKKYAGTGDTRYIETAVKAYSLGFDAERRQMQDQCYDISKLAMLKQSRERSEKAIGLCWLLQQHSKNDHWAEQAFIFAEKNKAFVLLESIKRNIAANSVLQNDSNYQKVQVLQNRLSEIEKSIFENSSPELIVQKESLENDLQLAKAAVNRNNSYREVVEREDALSVAAAREQLLDDKTTLVEFFSGDTSFYEFAFSKSGTIRFIKLSAGIENELNGFLRFFAAKEAVADAPAAYQKKAAELYQDLQFASLDNKKTERLIIIPDGRFNLLPFEALITHIRSGYDLKEFNYLVNDYELSYGYSANTLLKKLEHSKKATNSIAGFAPVFELGERGRPSLLSSRDELMAIQQEWGSGHYFFGKAADMATFRRTAASADVLHIATHARADTGMAIPPGIDLYDSTLYLQELYTLQLPASLVILSACETGVGHIEKSEGPMSLARGFYYAGARNIITSLWSVDDAGTAKLFSLFYRSINDGPFATTLRKAKIEYIKNAGVSGASPYYWAGFIEIGYEKKVYRPGRTIWWIGIIALFAVAATFLFFRRKRMNSI